MALTRSMLKAMGIEEEKIDQIIDEHSETVEALKQQRDANQSAADELKEAKQRLAEIEPELKESQQYKAKFENSQKELDDLKASIAQDKDRSKRETLYRGLLRDSGIAEKRIDAVLKVSDLNALEINDDGALANEDAIRESITKEWAEFIPSESRRGADVDNPPDKASAGMTKDEILAIKDTAKRQAAMAENFDLFDN